MRATLEEGWNGRRWKLWALLGGVLSIPVAVGLALVVALATGERVVPLILLMLVAIILAGSLVGSGVIDTLSSQMNRGGLARESTDHVDKTLNDAEATRAQMRVHELKDRRTVRAGIFIVPPFVAFLFMMTVI